MGTQYAKVPRAVLEHGITINNVRPPSNTTSAAMRVKISKPTTRARTARVVHASYPTCCQPPCECSFGQSIFGGNVPGGKVDKSGARCREPSVGDRPARFLAIRRPAIFPMWRSLVGTQSTASSISDWRRPVADSEAASSSSRSPTSRPICGLVMAALAQRLCISGDWCY